MKPEAGRKLVKIARDAITLWVREGKEYEPSGYPKFLLSLGSSLTLFLYPKLSTGSPAKIIKCQAKGPSHHCLTLPISWR